MDMDCKNYAYTSAHNKEGDASVNETLYRIFYTMDWRVSYQNAKRFALLAIWSDHSSILFPKTVRRKKEFKYETF